MKKISKIFSKIGNFRTLISKYWKRLVIIAVILIVIVLIYKRVTREPSGITTQRVYRIGLINDFSANGKVKAKKQVDLKFYSPGRVVWIGVKNGDMVRVGQSVASLNTVSLNAVYRQSLNDQRNYQAVAEKVLDDVQGHEKDESFAQRATRTTAEVNRDNAYESVVSAKDNLRNAVLISPIAGVVTDTNDLIAGINLSGSDVELKFIRIVDPNSLYFEANIDEVDFSKVKLNQEVIVSVDSYPGEECGGKVSFVGRDGQETTGGVVTIPAEITFTECNLEYAAGLNGQAHFVLTKLDNVLVIPKKYIVNKDGNDFVWKQTGATTKNRKLVPVKVGMATSTEVEVTEGISEGDLVVFIP